MIKTLALRFGKSPGSSPLAFDCTPVTVFVGPNNSGKSKILQEIQRYCQYPGTTSTDVILDRIEFQPLSQSEAEARIAAATVPPRRDETLTPTNRLLSIRGSRIQIHFENLVRAMMNPSLDPFTFCNNYLWHTTQIMDGRNRISLVQEQPAGDLLEPSNSSFALLFKDDSKREELRRIIYEAFGLYLVIDPTKLGFFRLRLSRNPPSSPSLERGIDNDSVMFHSAAQSIDAFSDGIKAFTGMITETIAGNPTVSLIDEPEAFLHPHLSFLLGREISRVTAGSQKTLFVSTHSSHFVMGCVQSGVPITIVRLTYRDEVATARTLGNTDVLRLMKNPLLRSTGVLNGLFYECVVVTEADTDRAFYQEINERLQLEKPEWSIPNCLFINAQNRQTVPTITRPLRELGIPAASLVDIDVVKNGGAEWTTMMEGAFLPPMERDATSLLRSEIKKKFDASGRDMKRDGGIALLTGAEREAVENLFLKLAGYGLFVVPGGEVESWLKTLGVPGHGPSWLIAMFERMEEDPTNDAYVRPGENDVWYFMHSIKGWFINPARRGIPT